MVHQTACAKIVDENAAENPRELANSQRMNQQEIETVEGQVGDSERADITGIGGGHFSKQAAAAAATNNEAPAKSSCSLPRITKIVTELELVNARDHQGRTPLYLAAQTRDLDNVRLLLEHGADAKLRTADGSSVLLGVFDETLLDSIHRKEGRDEACRRVLVELLAAGAPLDSVDSRGRNVLHLAAELKLEETLKMLLARRGDALDLEARDHEGRTVLHIAAQTRNKSIVDLLLAEEASVESYTHEHKSVLHSLLDESIDRPEEKEEVNEIFDELASKFAEKNVPLTVLDNRRQSLLHLAAEHDCKDILQRLLPEFADYSGITTWGCTAVHTLLCSMDENDGEGKRSKDELDHCSTTALDGDDDVCTPPAASASSAAAAAATTSNVVDEKKIKIEPMSYDELLKAMFEKDERVVFTKDDEGRLPIHLAAKYKHGKTLKLLLKNYGRQIKNDEPEPEQQQTTTTSSEEQRVSEPSEAASVEIYTHNDLDRDDVDGATELSITADLKKKFKIDESEFHKLLPEILIKKNVMFTLKVNGELIDRCYLKTDNKTAENVVTVTSNVIENYCSQSNQLRNDCASKISQQNSTAKVSERSVVARGTTSSKWRLTPKVHKSNDAHIAAFLKENNLDPKNLVQKKKKSKR